MLATRGTIKIASKALTPPLAKGYLTLYFNPSTPKKIKILN
jgi:hypothetical protein